MNLFIVTTLLSLLILGTFIVLGVLKYGWKASYSSYAQLWGKDYPIHNVNLWSAVTIVSALLLVISTIQVGENSKLQFLGFLAPVYLAVAALTPKYQDKDHKGQKIAHYIGTSLCAVCSVLWIILVAHLWWVLLITVPVAGAAAYFTKTWRTSYIFWAEMSLFAAVFAVTIPALL